MKLPVIMITSSILIASLLLISTNHID